MIITNRVLTGAYSAECVNAAKRFDDKERSIVHFITTGEKNRMGQVIDPDGMDDTNYKNNPIVLWMHGSILANTADDLPIARSAWREKEGNGVLGKSIFHDLPLAKDIYYLNREGFLNAWSIGFRPINGVRRDQNDNTTYIDQWELLEYSSVAIPANASALNNMFEVIKTEEMKNSLTEMFAVELYKKEIAELNNKLSGLNNISKEEFEKMKNEFIGAEEYRKEQDALRTKVIEIVHSINKLTDVVNSINFKIHNS